MRPPVMKHDRAPATSAALRRAMSTPAFELADGATDFFATPTGCGVEAATASLAVTGSKLRDLSKSRIAAAHMVHDPCMRAGDDTARLLRPRGGGRNSPVVREELCSMRLPDVHANLLTNMSDSSPASPMWSHGIPVSASSSPGWHRATLAHADVRLTVSANSSPEWVRNPVRPAGRATLY